MSTFATNVMNHKYAHTKIDGTKETWEEIANRVAKNVLRAVPATKAQVRRTEELIRNRVFIPGGRYLYASGNEYHQTQNCLLMRVEDTREGWGDFLNKGATGLMSGAGVGADYSLLREEGAPIRKTGGKASGPLALMQAMNEVGRASKQGGDRRAALWAGLRWSHPDIFKFIRMKDWTPDVKSLKAKDFNFPAPMDGTNISVGLNDDFFEAYHNPKHKLYAHAQAVYWETIAHMLETGEPGFSVDIGPNAGETLRNACTEVSSRDDSDICNLGSINLARINSLAEMLEAVELGTAFLLAGTEYSDVPYPKVAEIRQKNRRLGLGLMGVHEWLLTHGFKYGPNEELKKYLEVYTESTRFAAQYAGTWGLSVPVKTRAMAPNGTIGIVGETSTSLEPIFCAAYKRRYAKGDVWAYEYVIDPTAKKLVDIGVRPENIEDAYSLAADVERRVAFQAWFQQYVDHGISSTINLPAWGTEFNNAGRVQGFGNMLIEYLPELRGITVYPDGARGGQPLNPVLYKTAMKHVGQVFFEQADICDLTRGGGCG
jgi:ribonucleoside-diphosphate reductase alpha chain